MTMTPESRQVLARYEDIAAQHAARVNQIGEEFAADLAKHDAAAAERDRVAAEALPAINAAHEAAKAEFAKAQAEAAEEKATTWTRETRPTVLSFTAEDDGPTPPHTPEPAPRPAPAETPTWPRDQRPSVLSFAVEDEAPPPPPRRQAPTPTDDQDDDWSGRSWVR
ncbi:hypothetical protein JOD54_000486 [Actinokineospora baliensis]|uniref:hypothetical protein n=1 Tax=Actinokineospora baliensis TaxID=547056 RepID=UPI0019572D2A|nr:hypothetical protein [Actinokineospora baliensis]MBM7770282.1 hypothetical protein [Actinokineospora baliensis]